MVFLNGKKDICTYTVDAVSNVLVNHNIVYGVPWIQALGRKVSEVWKWESMNIDNHLKELQKWS